ncbi:MAG: hypothetical protein DRQ89_09135 [Epsilonproteobacteria bacterium]|nr:MAG: hypothetical protein DRQ89_09135 [Campylobacterota bacterium]
MGTELNMSIKIALSFFLILSPLISSSKELNCETSLKEAEKKVLNIITQNDKKEFSKLILGSYNRYFEENSCDHNIIVIYNRSWSFRKPEVIFRYFHLDEWGRFLSPPVFVHASRPLHPSDNLKNSKIVPSYQCEQRFEWETYLTKWSIEDGRPFKSPWVGSFVLPRKKYPFCNYHIFMSEILKVSENGNATIWMTHFNVDEKGNNYFYPRDLKGRVIMDNGTPFP